MRSKSRCTGCPLFTQCLGAPDRLAAKYSVGLCPHCLVVRCGDTIIPVGKLCEEIYNAFVDKGNVTPCFLGEYCHYKEEARDKRHCYHVPSKLKYERRRYAK